MRPGQQIGETSPAENRDIWSRLRRAPGYARLSWVRQMLLNGDFRETARLRAFPPTDLFQPSGRTWHGRHPALFALARHLLSDRPDHHLLSFGCATGDEVFTLHEYFRAARITGVDISARRIRECNRRARRTSLDKLLTFVVGGSADVIVPETCDAVFALSVLRHGDLRDGPPRCDHRLRFVDFERIVSGLARCVRPGGLLVIRHASFRFVDTAAANDFELVLRQPRMPQACLYDTNNCLMPSEDEESSVFRRRS